MKRCYRDCLLAVGVFAVALATNARATLIESWENTDDGWMTTTENPTYSIAGFDPVIGVTDQSYSLILSGTAAPGYGQMLRSPFSAAFTNDMANAQSVSVDVLAGSPFGYQQWSLVTNGGSLGYHSVDNFNFTQSPVLGQESTLTWNISAADSAAYAADAASNTPIQLIFQVGGGGGGTMYLDNLRFTPVPEPASGALILLGACGLALLGRQRITASGR